MRILVACEFSGTVRDAFRARGHDAVSCDLVPSLRPGPHVVGDVTGILHDGWDMMLAFPPCTYLTNSNAWRWAAIGKEREEALEFVRTLMSAPIPRTAVENPAGAIGTHIRKADQYIQPWHFGDPWQKATGLWLRGLPLLRPEVTEKPADVAPWCQGSYAGRVQGYARKAGERSLTFAGTARAMAEQWGAEQWGAEQ